MLDLIYPCSIRASPTGGLRRDRAVGAPRASVADGLPATSLPAPQPALIVGLVLLRCWRCSSSSATSLVDTEDARPLSVADLQPPSSEHPFGTDRRAATCWR